MKTRLDSQTARRWGGCPHEPETGGLPSRYGSPAVSPHLTKSILVLSMLAVLSFAGPNGRAQQNAIPHATDFISVEYYEAPHQQQMKSRLSGAEAQPQAGGLLVIKQLKLETFNVEGKLEMAVNAPECVYDTLNGVAGSPGRLQLQTGDGKFRVEGDGFLWRQTNSFLIISNHVRTVIQNMAEKKN